MRRKSKSFCQIEDLELRRLLSTIYVDAVAPGPTHDGSSWTDAFTDLQSGLTAAAADHPSSSNPITIEVGQGTYTPSSPSGRSATFQLIDDVTIQGGYAGFGQPNPNVRDLAEYPTILSGDIGVLGNNSDNSYHVVTGSGTNLTATLDGFTVTAGNGNVTNYKYYSGGGLFNRFGSPTISNCAFIQNTAHFGGAVSNSNYGGPSPTFTNCAFLGNSAVYGGGMDNENSSPTLVNCTFVGNTSNNGGGAIAFGAPTLINCTLSSNLAENGHGNVILCDDLGDVITLTNCIVWGGADPNSDFDLIDSGSPAISYSDIEGGWTGTGNIDAAPIFVRNPSAGADGAWGTADDDYGDLQLQPYSPGVDAGNNNAVPANVTTDLAGNNRFQDVPTSSQSGIGTGALLDMGAYEATPTLAASAGGPYYVVAGQNLSLAGLGASNVAGSLNYTWDLNGDGIFGDATGSDPVFSSSGYSVGTQLNISLKVTDADMNSIVVGSTIQIVPSVLFVDESAAGTDNGTSWANAYTNLQTALSAAVAGETVDVAQGIYFPTSGADRNATFQLKNGVSLEGGFAGDTSATPDARDVNAYPSTLSGDIGVPGDNSDNSYHVVTSAGNSSTAVLDGFTIAKGNASYPYGGGLFDLFSSPTINYCTISGNNRGGILNEYSSPVLNNCVISGNSSDSGNGGGIRNVHSSPILNDSTISGNNSPGGGGGIYDYHSSPVLTDCTITGNTANDGGGMANIASSPILTDCIFTKNKATGTTSYYGYSYGGGAISNRSSSFPILTGCTLSGNTANAGGAIRNAFLPYDSPYDLGADCTLTNCTITGNTANIGGGIYDDEASPILINCTISGNIASNKGGGMSNYGNSYIGSTPMLTNCIISGNIAGDNGGGMYDEYSSPTLTECQITGNTATENDGGGIDNRYSSPTLNDCILNDNMAGANGGAMHNFVSSPTLADCTISGNTASDSGGGVYNAAFSSPILTDCILSGNSASANGGGMENHNGSDSILINCTLSGNTAGGAGGGMINGYYSSPTLTNCVIAGNTANGVGGGGIADHDSSPTLINCTLSGNVASTGYGGAVANIESSATLTNCILWGDAASTGGNEIYNDVGSSVTITYSDIGQSGFTGTGDIDADPRFIRNPGTNGTADYGDLELQSTSPCIDTGSNAALPAGTTTDIAGNSRFVNTRGNGTIVDMGAYEYGLPIRLVNNKINFSQVTVTFSADVATSISAGDLQLTPAGSSTPISAEGVTYDTATSTATFDLPNLAGGIYAASINSISDANGNILSGGFAENLLLVGNDQTLVLPGSNQTYTVQQWTFGSNSSLDIGNNTLIIQYAAGNDPASAFAALIVAGDADGQWNGPGITSSAIASDTPGTTAVGYYDDTTDGQITIRRSWIGDANLDGVINSDDLSLMLLGQTQGGTRWQDGNFNYGTQVNADDWSRFFYAVAYSNGQNISNATVPAAMLPAAAPAFSQAQIASADDLNNLLDS